MVKNIVNESNLIEFITHKSRSDSVYFGRNVCVDDSDELHYISTIAHKVLSSNTLNNDDKKLVTSYLKNIIQQAEENFIASVINEHYGESGPIEGLQKAICILIRLNAICNEQNRPPIGMTLQALHQIRDVIHSLVPDENQFKMIIDLMHHIRFSYEGNIIIEWFEEFYELFENIEESYSKAFDSIELLQWTPVQRFEYAKLLAGLNEVSADYLVLNLEKFYLDDSSITDRLKILFQVLWYVGKVEKHLEPKMDFFQLEKITTEERFEFTQSLIQAGGSQGAYVITVLDKWFFGPQDQLKLITKAISRHGIWIQDEVMPMPLLKLITESDFSTQYAFMAAFSRYYGSSSVCKIMERWEGLEDLFVEGLKNKIISPADIEEQVDLHVIVHAYNTLLKEVDSNNPHFFDIIEDPFYHFPGLKKARKAFNEQQITEKQNTQLITERKFTIEILEKLVKNIKKKVFDEAVATRNAETITKLLSDLQEISIAQVEKILSDPLLFSACVDAGLDHKLVKIFLSTAWQCSIITFLLCMKTLFPLANSPNQQPTSLPCLERYLNFTEQLKSLLREKMGRELHENEDVLSVALKEGLLDIPQQPIKKDLLDIDIIQRFELMDLQELLRLYEHLKAGFIIYDNPIHNTETLLMRVRSIIIKKINELDNDKRLLLKPAIDTFKTTASAAQYSGTLHFAHRFNITGKEVSIAICEPDVTDENIATAIYRTIGKRIFIKIGEEITETKQEEGLLSHAYHVSGIITQIASNAFINLLLCDSTLQFKDEKIVNCSFGTRGSTISEELVQCIESKKLIILSAGNDGKSLDSSDNALHERPDFFYYNSLDRETLARCIWVGGLDPGNVPSIWSNRPGENKKLQEHFLYTLGSDVLSLTSDTTVGSMSGTSMAAPIVTGAAALIQSLCPSFTPEEIAECLTESADRDFWIHHSSGSIHVVAPHHSSCVEVDLKNQTTIWPYDKRVFGKGILNVRRALQYAFLKSEYQIQSELICKILDFKEQQEALKIQRWFRKKKKQPSSHIELLAS